MVASIWLDDHQVGPPLLFFNHNKSDYVLFGTPQRSYSFTVKVAGSVVPLADHVKLTNVK